MIDGNIKFMRTDRHTRRISYCGLCLAIALILSYVEAMLPINLGVPGAKIGLPNIITVLLLYTAGGGTAFIIGILRIILNGFLFGNLFAIAYSAAGFFVSLFAMYLLKRTDRFGITGVSLVGGIMHNLGQISMAALITNGSVFAYLPVLIFAGGIAGVLIGLVGSMITGRASLFLRHIR